MYSVLFHARETGIAYVISTILNTFTNEGFKLFFDVENK